MTVTARESLGDVILNGSWFLDVNTGTIASPTWTPVNGIYDFKEGLDTKTIDVSDFSSDGWSDSQNVGKSWSIELKVWRKRRAASVAYDPGQEFIRLQNSASIQVRFYEMSGTGVIATGNPRVEAYMGLVSVKWSPDGGKFDDGRSVSVTLTGKGKRTAITHPSPNV